MVYDFGMRAMILTGMVLLLVGCGKSDKGSNTSGNPVTAPVDYLGAVNKGQKAANRVADLAPVQQAVQVFYGQEDRYPANLQELVTKRYIAAVPEAPAGFKLQYNPQTGELKMVKAAAAP